MQYPRIDSRPNASDATPSVALQKRYAKIVGHENADYIKFSVFAQYNFRFWWNFTYTEKKHFIYQR